MYRLIAAVCAVSTSVGVAQAQTARSPEAGPLLTLQRALELAGADAPSLEAATWEVRGAKAAREEAGLRPNPTVSIEAENVAGTGSYRGFDAVEVTASIELPIELGGKRSARIGVADAHIRRATIEAAVAQADLRYEVTQAYAEAVAAEQRLNVARDQERIGQELRRIAEGRVRDGLASPIEFQQASVFHRDSEANVERLARLLQVAQFTLTRLVGAQAAMALDGEWFERVAADDHRLVPIDNAETLALAEAEANVAIADAQVRLARSNRVPDPALILGTRRFEETGESAALAGVSITLPLFNGGRAAVSQAVAERERAEAQRRNTLMQADLAVARAQVDLENAVSSAATVSGPVLATMEESTQSARIGYRQGDIELNGLLEAEDNLAQTRVAGIDALLTYHLAKAQLERLLARRPSEPAT